MAKIPLKRSLNVDRPTGAQAAKIIDVTEPFPGSFGNEQVIITWELAAMYKDLQDKDAHFMHSEFFTLSIHEKSALRKILLNGMTGKVLSDAFFEKNFPEGFDTEKLLGKPMVLVLQPKDDEGHQKLIAVMPPTPEATAIVPSCKRPPWIDKMIKGSAAASVHTPAVDMATVGTAVDLTLEGTGLI